MFRSTSEMEDKLRHWGEKNVLGGGERSVGEHWTLWSVCYEAQSNFDQILSGDEHCILLTIWTQQRDAIHPPS